MLVDAIVLNKTCTLFNVIVSGFFFDRFFSLNSYSTQSQFGFVFNEDLTYNYYILFLFFSFTVKFFNFQNDRKKSIYWVGLLFYR